MADLSKVTLPNNITYNFADAAARSSLSNKQDKALIGQADDPNEDNYLTPTQVAEALRAGREAHVAYLDIRYGVLRFASWNIAESFSVVVSNAFIDYNGGFIEYTLYGSTSSDEWSANAVLLASADAMDAYYTMLEYKAESAGASADYAAKRTASIPYAQVDATSTATAFTATVPGITELRDGVCMLLKNGVVTSASGFTINVNGLGAKPSYTNLAAATADTTIFNVSYTMLFVYDESRVSGGCWICYRGYDANTNTIGYQVRTNSYSLPMKSITYRYRLLFTSADGAGFVPANNSSSTNATAARTVCQDKIDPFGSIVYYGTTASVAAGSRPSAANLWQEYTLTLGYSFNRTGAALELTSWKPVYVKAAPQTDGSAIIDATTPYVQDLPTTADGKIYIYLGVAYSATSIELNLAHPVYYHDGTGIKPWTGIDLSALATTQYVDDLVGDIDAADVNAIPSADKGAAGGVAELDANGKVPASQLPIWDGGVT